MAQRSKVALMMCIDQLFERSAHVYMWTFTFPETQHAWLAASAWLALWTKLRDYYGRSAGVRVMEFHKDHGIHFHVLIDRRVSVHVVRRMCVKCGFGRVHVCEIQKEDRYYVAKYVNKDRDMPAGLRRWASFGTRHKTRCRDLEMRSSVADAMREAYVEAKAAGKPKGICFAAMERAKQNALLGDDYRSFQSAQAWRQEAKGNTSSVTCRAVAGGNDTGSHDIFGCGAFPCVVCDGCGAMQVGALGCSFGGVPLITQCKS